nr:hypothetical protein [Vibrio vulnificus]
LKILFTSKADMDRYNAESFSASPMFVCRELKVNSTNENQGEREFSLSNLKLLIKLNFNL